MIFKEDLLKGVKSAGFMTYPAIKENYVNGTSEEIVEMTLTAMVSEGSLKRVKCMPEDGAPIFIYFIPA